MDVPSLIFEESEEEVFLDNADDDEELDVESAEGVVQDLALCALPYLKDGVDEAAASAFFKNVGVKVMSDVRDLTEQDLTPIMAPLQSRKWLAKQKQGNVVPESRNIFCLGRCISASMNETLQKPEMMDPRQRKLVIHAIGDYIHGNWSGTFKEAHSLAIAKQLCERFKVAFGLLDINNQSDFKVMVKKLSTEIVERYRYLNSRDHSSNRANKRGRPRNAFSKYQEYALIPEEDKPVALPEGETMATLELKRKEMVLMQEDSTKFVKSQMLRLMDLTYVCQRLDVNKELSAEELLVRWPFLGVVEVMEKAFRRLTKLDINLNVAEREEEVVKLWLPFMKYLSHLKRKGTSSNIPKKLARIFKDSTYSSEKLFTLIRCLVTHLGIPTNNFYICFEDTTSYDEVNSSELLPDDGRPILAILGSDPLPTRRAFVVVDKRVLNRKVLNLRQSVHLLFQSYFYFKITYNHKMAPVLEFIQRKLYDIDEPGTRSERIKTNKSSGHAPSDINKTYASLQKSFLDYYSQHHYDR